MGPAGLSLVCYMKANIIVVIIQFHTTTLSHLCKTVSVKQFARPIENGDLHASHFYCSVALYGFQVGCQNTE